MTQPLISVIVNNHNYAHYLGAAIESALAQDYPRFEVVVVDDGSSDGSRELIHGYGSRVVPVFKPNGGQTSAFNAGYAAARGDIIYLLDADDVLLPGALATIAPLFEDGCVKAHWPMRVIDQAGASTAEIIPKQALPSGDLRTLILRGGPEATTWPPTSGNAFARKVLERLLPLDEIETELGLGSASADAFLSTLAPLFGTVASVNSPLACYRVHSQNDYAGMPSLGKLQRDYSIMRRLHARLALECARRGWDADRPAWERNSWVMRLHAAREQVKQHLPEGASFLLIDEDQWSAGLFPGHRVSPFPSRDGRYWGPPATGAEAAAELQRGRSSGYDHVVLGWPAFWWLEHYPELAEALEANYSRVAETAEVILFRGAGAHG